MTESVATQDKPTLSGRRVLLVEDNYLVGAAMRHMLVGMGCEVVGPIATVDAAVRAAQDKDIDAGLLDINIIGGTSAPVASTLARQGRPFVFVSGYGSSTKLPDELKSAPRLRKPVDEGGLGAALGRSLG